MSNNAKFWIVRIAIAAIIVFDLYAINQMQAAAYGGSIAKWFWILITSVALSVPLFLYYYYLKSRRWGSETSSKKVEIETLAILGQQKKEERRKKNLRY